MWSDGAVTVRIDPSPSTEPLPAAGDLAVVRDGPDWVVAAGPSEVIRADGPDALAALDDLRSGWWAGFLSYDLGRTTEPYPPLDRPGPAVPDLLLARFDSPVRTAPLIDLRDAEPVGPFTSSITPDEWRAKVGTIARHLYEGDCYQVNLTRQLMAEGEADPVALFASVLDRNPVPHAALVRIGDIAVVSASPELFLRRDGTDIETRPIKGTAADRATLEASEKDRAENVMIVDLSRNDLGRVCAYGSIHVPSLFEIEEHPGLFHLVSTARGKLRDDVSVGDVVRATFPPASVTGCPKPRVLQIIEELEPTKRGVYCGAIGFIDADNDRFELNVAIRTFLMTGGRTYFGVGGGIVADSDADAEWQETELKARNLIRLVN
jgi:para-aminobenzoate synthetase component I